MPDPEENGRHRRQSGESSIFNLQSSPPLTLPARRRVRRARQAPATALALFVALAALYIVTSGGHTYSYDEETMFGLTQSLVERGSVVVPTCAGCPVIRSTPAPDGRNYSRYGPLQSLVAVPLYVAGRAAAGAPAASAARWFTTRFAVDLLNAVVTAGIATLLYGLARGLGYGARPALATALLYGLGTQAWPHAKTFFSEPLTALLILGAVACWWRLDETADGRRQTAVGRRESGGRAVGQSGVLTRHSSFVIRHSSFVAGVGLCCGLAMATKVGAAIVLPVLGLAVVVSLARAWRGGVLAPCEALTAGLAGAVALAVPVALVGWYNYARFGSPFETGYGATEAGAIQSGNFLGGLAGLLVSPGKSIVLFSPVVLLALPCWFLFARKHRAFALVAGGLIAVHLAFYARVPYWHGDVAWGPRYLDFVLPLLVLPLAAGFAWLGRQSRGRRRVIGGLAALVVVAAVGVQLLGVLVNFDTVHNRVTTGSRYWTAANAPPYVAARLLGERVGAWAGVRFPRADAVVPGAGFDVLNEDDPLWPRFLPAEAVLRVHAGGAGTVAGALLYEDARARRDPPLRLTILVNGRPAADARETPAPESGDPYAYRLAFTIRPAGAGGDDFTITIRNDSYAQLGPTRLLAFAATRDGAPLPALRRPQLLPFPPDSAARWSWFLTDRNQHLVDLWPWYVGILHLPARLARLFAAGAAVAAAGLALGLAGLLMSWRQRDEFTAEIAEIAETKEVRMTNDE
ncbi:MAG TPA: hypothetical protein VFW96_07645 [Thermomicrobiales bacterium]|nr:hypothetical protein [Thermomicrobiales bacterium]